MFISSWSSQGRVCVGWSTEETSLVVGRPDIVERNLMVCLGLEEMPKLLVLYFQAIWENQFYYLFGFLFLVFIILVVSCGLISVVVTYFILCAEVRFSVF